MSAEVSLRPGNELAFFPPTWYVIRRWGYVAWIEHLVLAQPIEWLVVFLIVFVVNRWNALFQWLLCILVLIELQVLYMLCMYVQVHLSARYRPICNTHAHTCSCTHTQESLQQSLYLVLQITSTLYTTGSVILVLYCRVWFTCERSWCYYCVSCLSTETHCCE